MEIDQALDVPLTGFIVSPTGDAWKDLDGLRVLRNVSPDHVIVNHNRPHNQHRLRLLVAYDEAFGSFEVKSYEINALRRYIYRLKREHDFLHHDRWPLHAA